jgi:hypothetical protein
VSLSRTVLDEVAMGTPTVAEIARRAGVDRGLVELAVERLVAAGRLDAQALAGGCPPEGCGTCGSGASDCSANALDGGAVLLTLGSRHS